MFDWFKKGLEFKMTLRIGVWESEASMTIIRDIGFNIMLLFGLTLLITLPPARLDMKKAWVQVLFGSLIGAMTVFVMMNAWQLASGAIFDGRSIMISVTALFFPWPTALIASLISTVYRASLGGPGVYAGILSIQFAFLLGISWKLWIGARLKVPRWFAYYLFGLLVHVCVVLAQLTFPYPQNFEVIRLVGPLMLIGFPIATAILCVILFNHQTRLVNEYLLKLSEKKYRTLINNAKVGIIQYDTRGVIELANQDFANLLRTTVDALKGLDMTSLPNPKIVACVRDSLLGIKTMYEGEYRSFLSGHVLPVRAQFAPIYEENRVIGGIGIAEDLTEAHAQKKTIDDLQKKDRLTGVFNRSSFDDAFFKDAQLFTYPVTLVVFDVNGFQIFNMTFGYEQGNQILKQVAEVIDSVTEPYPAVHVYRTGGDEFSLIAEAISEADVLTIIKDVKKRVEGTFSYEIKLIVSSGYSITNSPEKPLSDVYNEALVKLQENKVYEGSSISKKTVDIIMSALFEKSPREKMHSERVSALAEQIARQYTDDPYFISCVRTAGKLHDIGKINISEKILDKPGSLTDDEYDQIKKHPNSGYRILSSVPEYAHIANIVLTHHERVDGRGYPGGLKQNDILLEARIIAVADAFDAMTEQRTYREALSHDAAIAEIKRHRGTQFDPDVVDKFLKCLTLKKDESNS